MEWLVPLADLDYGIEEEQAVIDVLRSKWLTMGARTQAFEQAFAAYTGAKYALAVSNATQALHLACLALGIGPGDEVIVPSLSFVATSNAVLYTGAEVRFADILGPHNLTIDPVEIERQVTPCTKAVIVMHYAGYPCDMEAILEVARRHGLVVIEDAAHAPGAMINGRHVGRWGEIGCFSFFSNKNLSTGEGGMLTTERDDLAERLRILRSHGMTSLTWDRHKGHAYSYDVVDLGYNDRIDEMRAALGIAQLAKLEGNNARRAEITRQYWRAFEHSGLGLPFREGSDHAGLVSAYHIFPVLLPAGIERKAFIDAMRAQRIQTSIHYPPIHMFSYYRQRYGETGGLERTESAGGREVTLPLYPTMGEADVDRVVQAVGTALDRAG